MAGQGRNVSDPEMAPAIDGRRQVEAVLWVKFGRRGVGHGILWIAQPGVSPLEISDPLEPLFMAKRDNSCTRLQRTWRGNVTLLGLFWDGVWCSR